MQNLILYILKFCDQTKNYIDQWSKIVEKNLTFLMAINSSKRVKIFYDNSKYSC